MVAAARGVHLQPPELARRHDRHEAAARGRDRGGQEGGRAPAGHGPDRVADEHGLRRPRQHGAGRRRRSRRSSSRSREGYSLAISPEGTRSPTPRVGPFKKGAFHMAHAGAASRSCRSSSATPASCCGAVRPFMRTRHGRRRRAAADRRRRVDARATSAPTSTACAQQFVDTLADWPSGMTRPIQVTVLGGARGARRSRRWPPANAHTVLWARSEATAAEIRDEHRNSPLPADLDLAPRPARHVVARRRRSREADVLVVGVPSHGLRAALLERRAARPPVDPDREPHQGPRAGHADAARPRSSPRSCPATRPACSPGPNLAREVLGGYAAAAVIAMPDEHVAGVAAGAVRQPAVPRLHEHRRARLRARRRAQERDRDRGRHGRGPRRRRQHARDGDHARAGRDHPARRCDGRRARRRSPASPGSAT